MVSRSRSICQTDYFHSFHYLVSIFTFAFKTDLKSHIKENILRFGRLKASNHSMPATNFYPMLLSLTSDSFITPIYVIVTVHWSKMTLVNL